MKEENAGIKDIYIKCVLLQNKARMVAVLLLLSLEANNDFPPHDSAECVYSKFGALCLDLRIFFKRNEFVLVEGSCIIRNAPSPWLSCPIDGQR